MRVFFSVGEPSGDLHASKLIRALQSRCPEAEFFGFGGTLMQNAGCRLIFRLTDLAVMGILPVIPLLWKFIRLARAARRYLIQHRPDVVVLVDFPGFNWWIARAAKREGIPVYYYLPPQLWSWAPWRIRKMRRLVDYVLCCLPFEAEWYRRHGMAAELVGHPFFDEVREHPLDESFVRAHASGPDEPPRTVAILPGSRRHEVSCNFPVQMRVMEALQRLVPDVRFLVACYKEPQRRMCEEMLRRFGRVLPVELHVGRTSEIIAAADAALMVSGSVSLELMARRTPAVVIYRVARLTYWIGWLLVTCRFASLPNLIAGREILPEFITCGPRDRTVGAITHILHGWLAEPSELQRRREELSALAEATARPGATLRTAEFILTQQRQIPRPTLPPRAAA
jgi:lipid-A-disaccharide synthase